MLSNLFKLIINFLKKQKIRSKWKHKNKGNFTFLDLVPQNDLLLEQIEVGDFTYGPIWAAFSGDPNEFLKIGSFCSIGSGTKFIPGSEHNYKFLSTYPFKVKIFNEMYESINKGNIEVNDDVWFGEDCLVLSGVKIGQGAVVAARSVVTKSIPAYHIYGGNPAKLIKPRFDEYTISQLEKYMDYAKLDVRKEFLVDLYNDINEQNVDLILKKLGMK